MAGKNKVGVRIAGKEYILKGVESDDYIQKVAFFVDKKLSEISKSSSLLSTTSAAVLTSINLADDYFKSVEAEARAIEGFEQATNIVEKLKAEILKLNSEVVTLNEKNSNLTSELAQKESELGELKASFERTSKVRFYTK